MSPRNNMYQSYPPYDNYYPPQASANDGPVPQWPPPGAQSVAHTLPSPSVTVHSAGSAPQSSPHRLNFSQPDAPTQTTARTESRVGVGSLSTLATTAQAQRAHPVFDSRNNADPIERYFHEEPWNAMSMRNPGGPYNRPGFLQPNMYPVPYPSGPPSEGESSAHKSDSGYRTIPTYSVISSDLGDRSQDMSPDDYNPRSISIPNPSGDPHGSYLVTHAPTQMDLLSQYSGRSHAQSTTSSRKEFPCPDCKEVSKCQSDHKKHMLRHHKPFKCDVPNCRRAGKGFGTINDLSRHKKSVHRIGAHENSFQCASENCKNKSKIWPRLDNFKQHIHRMHSEEDEADLIRKSSYKIQESPIPLVPPMDTALAGIGTEKQYSSNDIDDPASGISLTPDQETTSWTHFDSTLTHPFPTLVGERAVGGHHHHHHHQYHDSTLSVEEALSNNVGDSDLQDSGPLHASNGLRMSFSGVARGDAFDSHHSLTTDLIDKEATPEPQAQATTQVIDCLRQSTSNADKDEHEDSMPMFQLTQLRRPRKRHTKLPTGADKRPLREDQATPVRKLVDIVLTKRQVKSMEAGLEQATKSYKCTFDGCEKSFGQQCKLTKHKKRHERPYICTDPECKFAGGALGDLKRHDESQHSNPRVRYRCRLSYPSSQGTCNEVFRFAKGLKRHLKVDHGVKDSKEISREVKEGEFGPPDRRHFWCGFCNDFQASTPNRPNYRIDFRWGHIGRHYTEDKLVGDDWRHLTDQMTVGAKLDIEEEERDSGFEENPPGEDDDDGGGSDDKKGKLEYADDNVNLRGVSPVCSEATLKLEVIGDHRNRDQTEPGPSSSLDQFLQGTPNITAFNETEPIPVTLEEAVEAIAPYNSRKRQASIGPIESEPQPKRIQTIERIRYCCACLYGPFIARIYSQCIYCHHQFCNNCVTTEDTLVLDDGLLQDPPWLATATGLGIGMNG